MAKTTWKEIAELIGITAIVASLIFVGLQMRQSHEIALVTLYQMRADAAREIMIAGMESDDLRDAYLRIDLGEEPLTHVDQHALYSYMSILLNQFENAHFLYQRGFLTEEHWQSDLQNITGTLRQDGAIQIYNETKGIYRQSFIDQIEAALAAPRTAEE